MCYIFHFLFTPKDLFDRKHNMSYSTLYPNVLKIETIIIVEQNSTKMPFVYYLQSYKSINLATLLPGRLNCRVARNGFVNNKRMAFWQKKNSQQLLFLFSKHLDKMSNVTDCATGQTDL